MDVLIILGGLGFSSSSFSDGNRSATTSSLSLLFRFVPTGGGGGEWTGEGGERVE